ncbi:TonB-dependent receptor [Chitinophaga pinensis]|uniref:TonB-dependent receptor n=1 Tax=Chitinophaga pinensis (strain ATCC 43595 / DSM 2588 / LMG 13176 / NBRC 15968 / NCIMB 11800 / UQM 2034) TaxID=485918 RepID=A0A979G9B7_CHIPD|nr:TonB-dependent receptor [Chitinophaga pinensis]ACU63344.1 TonB-dependent receptor [Chitinophaga pinensis DSM 2588]
MLHVVTHLRSIVLPLLAFLCLSTLAYAQTGTITGTVTDGRGPLANATVHIEHTNKGGYTNAQGRFSLEIVPGTHTVQISYVGFVAQRKTVTVSAGQTTSLDVVLAASTTMNELVVLGSRNLPRTQTETPVPVDVIDIKRIAADAPQVSINQILNYVAPSFSSGTQTVADGTDHIDPASLRGLGPDQVLVLVNGKRRYNTALVNVNGTFGRGAVGTDMNSIPTSAIDRVEILRDGAAAQYGSDAIAGVINIILKSAVNKLTVNVTTGANVTSQADNNIDGQTVQTGVNYGIPVGQKGGYINFGGSYDYRNYTNRSGPWEGAIYRTYPGGVDKTDSFLLANNITRNDIRMRAGQSRLRSAQLFVNANIPLENDAEVYFFGGIGYRNGDAAGVYRLPHDSRNIIDIYPLGFLPMIQSDIYDRSLAAGIRGHLGDWKVDFSNTYGRNEFGFKVENSLNASLQKASPTRFTCGGPVFTQNTTNLDFSRRLDVLQGLDIAFGAEHRFEQYELVAGAENSYTDYGRASQIGTDANGNPILIPDPQGAVNTIFGPDGTARPGGAQVFPGFRPENAIKATRSAISGYVDVEANFTNAFLLGGALRFENYNDFGSTLNGKLTTRYKLSEKTAVRASASTGFRAPSLHQRYYSSTSTLFVDGVPYEVGTFTNDSRPAQLLGIPELKPEKSKSISAGFTGSFGKFNLTLDGYYTRINDRIVYTDQFSGNNADTASAIDKEIYQLLSLANANRAAFFANAINSETKGVDLVLTYSTRLGGGTFRADLSGTYSYTQRVGEIKSSEKLKGKESIYFSRASRIYLERSVPREKVNLTLSYNIGKFNAFLRNVHFGSVEEATNDPKFYQTFSAKVVTDVAVGYKLTPALKLSVGSNNVFDVYPDLVENPANTTNNQFRYSRRATQFGYNGRFLFARLELNL